ncbi:MAG: polysaccharide biosynthesis protein [Fimbriimonadaceae bacterium]|nr:MAG: polysaccharide biosynthesis protein [Fimbriimonadaceae bacterium]
MNLYLITPDPALAQMAVQAGVDRIFVDLELDGKVARQGHRDTVISRHTLDDVRAVRQVVPAGGLLVRVNPWGVNSEQEIEQVIAAGADLIMLPMFTTFGEVQAFTKCVDGRAITIGLVETPQALARMSSILENGELDEIYFGLNDLHLAMGLDFLFEVLAGGFLDQAARLCREAQVSFGIGGVARIGEGDLPAELILGEHERLGSQGVILSRAFTGRAQQASDLPNDFDLRREVMNVRECASRLASRTGDQRAADHEKLVAKVHDIVARQPAKQKPKMAPIQMEQLLNRPPIQTDITNARSYIEGESVLITGGGGSIGSEIARQLIPLKPKEIILAGKGENSVFEARHDLQLLGFEDVTATILDVQNRAAVDRLLEKVKPSVVFHAAAYKHVHFMENAPIQAVKNNVFGTKNVAELAAVHGVKKFILVSTDKAVNPTNIMGASKRAAEMILLSLSGKSETQFTSVRFGNVLGSRGSLIPILQKQIAAGGPVTITDERMTRYFMTIPEAAQLVIQAGAQNDQGTIYILDMGEPVRIVELVNRMLDLHGLRAGRDIEVQFIGARPGEKLHEELNWSSEDLEPTGTSKLLRLKSAPQSDWTKFTTDLDSLDQTCEQGNELQVRELLMKLIAQT